MASRTGYQTIFLKPNVPNTQPSGVWSGVATPITYLDRGTYLCNFNVSYIVGSGVGNITQTLTAVTADLQWTDVNCNIITSTPNTGALGSTLTQPLRQVISNIFTLENNNTPIFLYLECSLTGTWGLTTVEPNLNVICFTKISN